MEKILNFLILAIKWLSKPLSLIKSPSVEEKYIPAQLALNAIELSAAYWISLCKQYSEVAKSKKSDPLKEIHLRVKAQLEKYEELKGFDLVKGNPFLTLIALNANTRANLIEKSGEDVVVIEANLLTRMVVVILTYNFFKKYKVRAGSLFTKAESDMRELVECNKLPGRFSWNNFVIHEVKEKRKPDFSFLDEYGPAITEGVQQKTDDQTPNDEQSSSSPIDQSFMKTNDQLSAN